MDDFKPVPDTRSHRGPDPEDSKAFAPSAWPDLRMATSDLCWMLNRGYTVKAAVELIGNRYALVRRQRLAIGRCACSDEALQRRRRHEVAPETLRGQELWLDGYNVIVGIEAALAGGVILKARDGCYRDMATIYSSYCEVEETVPALQLIGRFAAACAVKQCHWLLDRPVSNSGRLRQTILETAANAGWNWHVDLEFNPDKILAATDQIAATADGIILDRCPRWLNLTRLLIDKNLPKAQIIDLT